MNLWDRPKAEPEFSIFYAKGSHKWRKENRCSQGVCTDIAPCKCKRIGSHTTIERPPASLLNQIFAQPKSLRAKLKPDASSPFQSIAGSITTTLPCTDFGFEGAFMTYAISVRCGAGEQILAASVALLVFLLVVGIPFMLIVHWMRTAVSTSKAVCKEAEQEGHEEDFDWDHDALKPLAFMMRHYEPRHVHIHVFGVVTAAAVALLCVSGSRVLNSEMSSGPGTILHVISC